MKLTPDRALARYEELSSTIRSPRAQQLTLTQGRERGAHCLNPECPGGQKVVRIETPIRTPVRRDGVIVNWATLRVLERYELQCDVCSKPWPILDAETKKPRRRRKEHVKAFDVEGAMVELGDLARLFRRPSGFSADLWTLHVDLWSELLRGRSYDTIAEEYGRDMAALGIGQGEEPSGRTVARMVRVARDLVASAIADQESANRAAVVRYALA